MSPSGRVSREHLSDETLIGQMRKGDREAYAELWRRHFRVGLRAARSFDHLEDPEDLVAEAFTRIFLALQEGNGPTVSFRPYLYTTIRNLALRRVRDLAAVQDVDLDTIVAPDTEDSEVENALDKSLTVSAFRALPERWQTVLWYTEVERMTPVQAGTLLGLTANATSALAFRARAALRAAWLQAHVADDTLDEGCRNALKHLGEYTQGTLSRREAQRVRDHLDTCTRCGIIAGEVDHVAGRLAIIMLPLVLGGAAALAFGHALAGAAGAGANAAAASSVPAIPPAPSPATAGAAASTTTAAGSSAASFTTIALIAAGAVVVVGAGVVGIVAINSSAPSTHQASPSTSDTKPTPVPTTSAAPTPVTVIPMVPDPVVPISPIVDVPAPPVAPVVTPGVTPVLPILPVLAAPTVDSAPTLTRLTTTLISGTGTPGAEIEASGPAPDASIPVAADGTWQWEDTALVEGVNTISFVQQEDGYQDSEAVSIAITVDTIAPEPPVIASTWSSTQTTPPQFSGTAEPLDQVTLSDQDGDLLETVTADAAGYWSSGALPGLKPTDTGLSVVQTDAAGNQSTASIAGFSFVPVITSPVDGSVMSPRIVPLTVLGWAGESVLVSLDGGAAQPFSFDASGKLDLVIATGGRALAVGSYSVTVRYGTASPTTTVSFAID
jgi:RNA polymerase sigma factor (sigma-70 family)